VLDGSGNPNRNIEFGANGFTGLSNLMRIGNPALVYWRARGTDCCSQSGGQFSNHVEILRFTQAASAGDYDIRILQFHFLGQVGDKTEQLCFRTQGGFIEIDLDDFTVVWSGTITSF